MPGPQGTLSGRPCARRRVRFAGAPVLAAGVLLGGCAPGRPPGNLAEASCGIEVSSRADIAITPLSGSVRLEGFPEDRIVDPGVRPGERRAFLVPCWAECVVVQGSGTDPVTRRTVRFEGFAELEEGAFVPLRLERRTGTQNPQRVARTRGCVTR